MEGALTADLWLKIALAVGCGGAVGLERELNDKPAGLRTNMLICVGSALITMVSLHVALTYSERQVNIADPGRIAAQIVSGVGFLGAGAIIQARGAVHGLTTAATIWVMAGIGLAVGSGMFAAAIVTTAVLLAILEGLGYLERHLQRSRRFVYFHVRAHREIGVLDTIHQIARGAGVSLHDFSVKREDGGERVKIEFALTCTMEVRDRLLEGILEERAVEDVRVNE